MNTSEVAVPGRHLDVRGWWLVLALPPLAFILTFYGWPVFEILRVGLVPDGALDLSPFRDVLTDPGLRRVAGFTAWQAVISTAVTFILALPVTHVVARRSFRGRRALESLTSVAFVLPTTVVATAFIALLGARGPLGTDLTGTLVAIVIAHAFFNIAVFVRVVGGLWSQLDDGPTQAARTMGASAVRAWSTTTLPALLPAFASAASIVFLFTFTSLGVVLILGGPGLATIEVEILRLTRDLLDLPTAAALAIVQLLAVAGSLWAAGTVQRRARRLQLRPLVRPAIRGVSGRLWLGVSLSIVGAVVALPIATLVVRSLRPAGAWSLESWTGLGSLRRGSVLFVAPSEAVLNTLWFGLQAATLALVLGGLAAVALGRSSGGGGRVMDGLLMLPLGTSAVTIGFGFLIALDTPPLDLRTSAALIPIAHALVATPFVVRVLLPVIRAIDPGLRDAARSLGASAWQSWRAVDLQLLRRPAMIAAGFAFAISAGEFGATLFIARPDRPTLPVAIYRLVLQPGRAAFGEAMVLSVILMVIVAGVLLFTEALGAQTAGRRMTARPTGR